MCVLAAPLAPAPYGVRSSHKMCARRRQAFQLVSLKLLAEQLLLGCPSAGGVAVERIPLYIPGEVPRACADGSARNTCVGRCGFGCLGPAMNMTWSHRHYCYVIVTPGAGGAPTSGLPQAHPAVRLSQQSRREGLRKCAAVRHHARPGRYERLHVLAGDAASILVERRCRRYRSRCRAPARRRDALPSVAK